MSIMLSSNKYVIRCGSFELYDNILMSLVMEDVGKGSTTLDYYVYQ